jgi:hypothetical protein
VVPAGEFTLTALDVASNGDLSFSGRRNADGRKIIGAVPAGGTSFTITSDSAPDVQALVRIN